MQKFLSIIVSCLLFHMDNRFQIIQEHITAQIYKFDNVPYICPFSATGRNIIGHIDDKITNTFPFYCKCSDIMNEKKATPKFNLCIKRSVVLLSYCKQINDWNHHMVKFSTKTYTSQKNKYQFRKRGDCLLLYVV